MPHPYLRASQAEVVEREEFDPDIAGGRGGACAGAAGMEGPSGNETARGTELRGRGYKKFSSKMLYASTGFRQNKHILCGTNILYAQHKN